MWAAARALERAAALWHAQPVCKAMRALNGRGTPLALAAALGLVAGCRDAGPAVPTVVGSGSVASEPLTVGTFHAVSLGGVGWLNMARGDSPALTVAEENILPFLVSGVRGGGLYLEPRGARPLSPTVRIEYQLIFTDLDALTVS